MATPASDFAGEDSPASSLPRISKRDGANWATTAGVVALLLMQFGLIGEGAEAKKLEDVQKFHALQMELVEIKNSVTKLDERMAQFTGDQWTRREMENWVYEMKSRAPEIKWAEPARTR